MGLLLVAGCSEQRHGPELVPVTGMVTYHAEPVEGATIVFVPQDHKFAAAARSDAGGRFQLKTLQAKPDDGAVPGTFKARIQKFYMTPDDVEIHQLPREYGDAETTTLTADVSKEQPNDFKFDLVDQR